MKIKLAGELEYDSIVNGEGLRTVIYTQGCSHRCSDCHNPQTWDLNGGIHTTTSKVVKEVLGESLIGTDITFSGGDPFLQSLECLDIAKKIKKARETASIWAYTGFSFEDILKDKNKLDFLKEVDVLVDGIFISELKSYSLMFKGSSNQRVIDVEKSLLQDKIILVEF